jgi:transcriptional regulator with XRE-family HTH domain
MREAIVTSPAAFGDLLHEHRLRVGLTQGALAEQAGVSERAISDLERGLRRAPHDDTIQRLADALALNGADRALLQAVAQRPRRSARDHSQNVELNPRSAVFRPPALPTRTIGRERELVAICSAFRDNQTRLLTLTGPGGSGKTRLSIAAATALADEFEWGAAFVPLDALTDP